MPTHSRFRPLVLYLLLVFAISSIGYALVIVSGHVAGANGLYVRQLMWSPAIAAILTMAICRRPLAQLGWRWGSWRWQILAWLVPLLYAAIAYGIVWTSGLGHVPNPEYLSHAHQAIGLPISPSAAAALMAVLTGTIGTLNISNALGEEIGWRGFLVPELYRVTNGNFTATGLISGAIWGLWHTPVLLLADYNNAGVPRWSSLTNFLLMVVASGIVFAWFRLRSASLWTGVVMHTSHNVFIQQFFTPITQNTGRTNYFIDEFGMLVPALVLLFAIYFWTRRGELPTAPEPSPRDHQLTVPAPAQ